jgi:hypothetical protein
MRKLKEKNQEQHTLIQSKEQIIAQFTTQNEMLKKQIINKRNDYEDHFLQFQRTWNKESELGQIMLNKLQEELRNLHFDLLQYQQKFDEPEREFSKLKEQNEQDLLSSEQSKSNYEQLIQSM